MNKKINVYMQHKTNGTRNITKSFAGLCSGRRLPPRRTLRLLGYFNFRRI